MKVAVKRHLIQGEHVVARDPEFLVSTVLGSCVAACLRDPEARIGGMNHFLLPGREGGGTGVQYGAYAMEVLINALLKAGARRDRLEAKLFGGAHVVANLSDIGRQNIEFAIRFLNDEGIAHLGGSLGGGVARRVLYWPASGVARQQLLPDARSVFSTESRRPRSEPGDLELFAA